MYAQVIHMNRSSIPGNDGWIHELICMNKHMLMYRNIYIHVGRLLHELYAVIYKQVYIWIYIYILLHGLYAVTLKQRNVHIYVCTYYCISYTQLFVGQLEIKYTDAF